MNYSDLTKAVEELDAYLQMRDDCVRAVAGAVLSRLHQSDLGIPAGELSLLRLGDNLVDGNHIQPDHLRNVEQAGRIGFDIRYQKQLGRHIFRVVALARFIFEFEGKAVTVHVGDDGPPVQGTLDDPKNEAFIDALARKTLGQVVSVIARMAEDPGIKPDLGLAMISRTD